MINGVLDKLGLEGDISCEEGAEWSVNAEFKNLKRKAVSNELEEYC